MSFDYHAHVFKYPELESILKKAVEFFSQTPVHPLPPSDQFTGPGVYGLYYTGDFELYAPIAGPEFEKPIYIGKAVPPGSRTARTRESISSNLIGRLREHARSIDIAANLKLEDFRCRFMILDNVERDLIVPVESELIRTHLPLWNLYVSGFGIHHPGSGRFGQKLSEWDTLHAGRSWGKNLVGEPRDVNEVIQKVKAAFAAQSQPRITDENPSLFPPEHWTE
jgi:hypothetical protein